MLKGLAHFPSLTARTGPRGIGRIGRTVRVGHLGRVGPLTLLIALGLTACASAPPAPIVARTNPQGGPVKPPSVTVQAAPVVSGRPSAPASAAPAQNAAGSGSSAARPAAAPARPASTAAPAPTRPAVAAAPPAAEGVQSTPLAPPTVESRPLDLRTPSPPASSPAPAPASSAPSNPPAAAGAVDVDFAWPMPGRVLQSYAETGKGIVLAGNSGDPVLAAADGRVIFSGSGPRGYGNLIIVKHPSDLLSVYAHNRKLLVKEGQNVTRGERIAELGETGGNSPRLHFEIRRQGKPVDPAPYLPRR